MKKISLCVAMAFALLSQANAQQTLYFGGQLIGTKSR